jgi:hypothetical protein
MQNKAAIGFYTPEYGCVLALSLARFKTTSELLVGLVYVSGSHESLNWSVCSEGLV